MMRNFYLIGIFLLYCGAFAQNTVSKNIPDSLEEKFLGATSDHERALLKMKLSDYWSYRDTVKAFSQLRESQKFIKEDDFLKGIYYFYKAGIYYDTNIDKAQNLYKRAENRLSKINSASSYEYRAKLWHNYASLDQIKGNNKSFLNITLEKCIPFAEKSGKKDLLSGYLVDVGLVFHNSKNFEKAAEYYTRAIKTLENTKNNEETESWVKINLANLQIDTNKYSDALKTLNSVEKVLKKIPESQYNSFFYRIKARYYNQVKQPTLALQTIEKGIAFSKSLNLDYDYLSLNYEKFRLLKAQKKNSEAKAVLEQILKDKKFYSNKKNRLVFLSEMAELEKENGNFESALRYTEQYLGLNDSVHADNEKMQMMNIESQFKTKEQEKALVHLETKNHQQKIILWISLALVLALVSFFLYAIRQRKKNNEQRLITLEQNRINEVKKALAEGENHERERIAKDLHDGIGGRITGIKINLEHLAQTTGIPELYTTVNQLEICLSEIRNTARNLTPETLHKFGLEEALKDFCQSLNTGNIRISCYIKNLNSCTDIEKQVHIFRIVQEAVTNVLKHASANKILVQCTLENQLLLIDVEDDGKGFTPDDKSKNLGLRNIQKRVDALGGKLKIESSEGNGTVLSVEANV